MVRLRAAIPIVGGLAILGAAVAVARHVAGSLPGREVEGGILMGNARSYEWETRLLKGSLFKGIAVDVATTAARVAPGGALVLEVGCGPGHLTLMLARDPHLHLTGLDLDPAMIERAQANATAQAASLPGAASGPSFVVGNVAEMPFGDASFDIVISTLSMHHWSDVPSGLAEISRVLRPNGRVLIWDIRPEVVPFHRPAPDAGAEASPLQVIDRRPWRWPWRFRILNRIELGAPASEAAS